MLHCNTPSFLTPSDETRSPPAAELMPVHHGGTSGIGTLLGPSGGYLWGFVFGVALIGVLSPMAPST